MVTELLHCCICPKQPNFSDISHLLTHVGSKGHLSFLHKLQVKSHQERPASQQLALYNQWYMEHNVAHLLSERMQQKELKQAKRKAENKRRCNQVKQNDQANVDPKLLAKEAGELSRSSNMSACGDDFHSISTNTAGYYRQGDIDHTPRQQEKLCYAQNQIIDQSWPDGSNDCQDPDLRITYTGVAMTPEIVKLKGTIWPGMDMFDSADEETQRKRNQRKDISVLEKMQAMSELVEPMETVTSPGGTMKKRRHMDDLEDDSPVEGESPITKPSTKRKRRPLATINRNRPRLSTQRLKSPRVPCRFYRTPIKTTITPSRTRLPDRECATQHRNHTAAGRPLAILTTANRNQKTFDLSDEEASKFEVESSPQIFSNPFHTSGRAHSQLRSSAHPTLWSRSTDLSRQTYDPFKEYRSSHLVADAYFDHVENNENANPLSWRGSFEQEASDCNPNLHNNVNFFGDTLGDLAEVYAFTRNPLINTTLQGNSSDKLLHKHLETRYQSAQQKPIMYR